MIIKDHGNKKTATKKRAAKKPATKEDGQETLQNIVTHWILKEMFLKEDPKNIAGSLKRSAELSKRKKSGPYQSAMSMLNFYINRAGKNLKKKNSR